MEQKDKIWLHLYRYERAPLRAKEKTKSGKTPDAGDTIVLIPQEVKEDLRLLM